jgi:hypothetical protein
MNLPRINDDFSDFSSGSATWFMSITIATTTCKRLLMELRRIGKVSLENYEDWAHYQKLYINQQKANKGLNNSGFNSYSA